MKTRKLIGGIFFRTIVIITLMVTIWGFSPNDVVQADSISEVESPRIIDLTISLYRDSVNDIDKEKYEQIIKYFADGIFEASNGAHKLGTIKIFLGYRNKNSADIVWNEECHPSANPSGIKFSFFHINMCDVFVHNGTVITNYLDSSFENMAMGGYALAHEMGHYYYGLYDEYASREKTDLAEELLYPTQPRDDDLEVPRSIMNQQAKAVTEGFEWLNFSSNANFTTANAQQRMYGLSAWELFGQTPIDEIIFTRRLLAKAKRNRYPELVDVAPDADKEARVDLPSDSTPVDSRSELEIVWVSGVSLEIVLDQSSSMEGEKIENVIEAAKLLIDMVEPEYTSIGIIAFNDEVSIVQPLTKINNEADKTKLKNTLDQLEASGRTAMGSATNLALDELMDTKISSDNKFVFLLSDGINNEGIDPMSILSMVEKLVPLYTFAYGSDADEYLLQQLATGSGGKFFQSGASFDEINNLFHNASISISPGGTDILTDSITVYQGETVDIPIFLDFNLRSAEIVLIYEGFPSDAQVTLLSPENEIVSNMNCSNLENSTICHESVTITEFGKWHLQLEAKNRNIASNLRVSGLVRNDQIPITAAVSLASGSEVVYPEPIVLMAAVSQEAPITGVSLSATITNPDNSSFTFNMTDDGISPDDVEGDGIYSAALDYQDEGFHTVTINFSNEAGAAEMTYASYLPSSGPDGEYIPMPDPVPFTDNFSRSVSLDFQVLDVQTDDHSNYILGSTNLPYDNTCVAGKMDYKGDVDIFNFQNQEAGTYLIRVSNLGLGMEPQLHLFSLGDEEIATVDINDFKDEDQYLYIPINLQETKLLYAEVTDIAGNKGGTYCISLGEPVGSETELTTLISGSGKLLPILIISLLGVIVVIVISSTKTNQNNQTPMKLLPARLVIYAGNTPSQVFPLKKNNILIGRGSSCDIQLMDSTVSRSHAALISSEEKWFIRDMQSQSGVFVNQNRISSMVLKNGDWIRIGNTTMQFQIAKRK